MDGPLTLISRTKPRRMISDQLKHMDAVCEILDARVPLSSRNPDVEELTSVSAWQPG